MALFRRRRYRGVEERDERGLVSDGDRHRPSVRIGLSLIHGSMLVFLLIVGLGPLLWLAKSAVTPTQDTLRMPMDLWPNGIDIDNLAAAWHKVHIDRYFFNTLAIAAGAWLGQIVVATTAGYALSVLRPRYAPILTGLVLATLFVPAVVLLVPLYLTVLDLPVVHLRLIDTFWAVWLPAGASAFNVIVVKRFFDNLPREVFEAARTDGAGPFTLFTKIVLPMSKPILGVVSVFALLASWKDFLWPLLVLTDPNKQPLSVRLPTIQSQTELGVFLAAMFIACLVPIAGYLIFQRSFLRGTGLSGALKG